MASTQQHGAKAGTHHWQESANSIGLVSYIVAQVYKQGFPNVNKFGAVHQRVAALQAISFLHVPTNHFLRTLPGPQHFSSDRKMLQLNGDAFAAFSALTSARVKQGVVAAVRLLDKARKKGQKAGGNVNNSDEHYDE